MDELSPTAVSGVAELQDVKVSTKSNGADYDVTWEVSIQMMAELLEGGDGHEVRFKGVHIGSGAIIRRAGTTRDADGGKHAKLFVRFAQSEIRRAGANLLGMIADNDTRGPISFQPSQITVDELLTKKAETDADDTEYTPEET
jgi:hypothetical protein